MTQGYGSKVSYVEGELLSFPDLSLTFIGQRHIPHAIYKPGFKYWDFEVSCNNENQVVSWTAGTGEITGTLIDIAGKRFKLELMLSDSLGQLANNELVLSELA